MMTIDLLDETESLTEAQLEGVKSLLQLASEREELAGSAEVSVSFVGTEEIHELNKDYRQTDRPTDVLSFAMQEGEAEPSFEKGEEGVPHMLGDIIISVPKAVEQAEVYQHSFMRELGFLAVHGFLHLCGYDHSTQEEERRMFAQQKEILQDYGLTR